MYYKTCLFVAQTLEACKIAYLACTECSRSQQCTSKKKRTHVSKCLHARVHVWIAANVITRCVYVIRMAANSAQLSSEMIFTYMYTFPSYYLTLEYYCNICNVSFEFKSKLDRHYTTASHKRFEKLLKCAPRTTSTSLLLQVHTYYGCCTLVNVINTGSQWLIMLEK